MMRIFLIVSMQKQSHEGVYKKLSLILSENVQENTCARVFFNKVVVYILNKHEMIRLTCYVLRIFCVLWQLNISLSLPWKSSLVENISQKYYT